MPRSLSTSRATGKPFLSRTRHCQSLLRRRQFDGMNKSNTQNKTKTKNKGKQKTQKTKIAQMVTAIRMEYDHLLKSPHLIKKDDPGVPTILCSINRCYFYNTVCDTGSGVIIMANVTYEFLYGTMPLDPTYAQLHLVDQSFHFVDGIAKNVPI